MEWAIKKYGQNYVTYGLSHLTCENGYVYVLNSSLRKTIDGNIVCDYCNTIIPNSILMQLKLLGMDV